jgi:peptidoglycan/LPS O-acetylase OafA/YrhL
LDRNQQLDGLRGFAALAVAVHHTLLGMGHPKALELWYATIQSLGDGYSIATKIALILFPGDVAVAIFFILSGAVLFNSLMHETRPLPSASVNFIYRRILRIYPALFISLMVYFFALPYVGVTPSFSDFFENAALRSFSINGTTWTLNVEFVVVPVFLAAYFAFRRNGAWSMVLFFLALWLGSALPWLKYPELARLSVFCFVLGMFIPTPAGQWLANRFPANVWPLLLILMLSSRHLIEGQKTGSNIQQISAALFVMLLYYDKVPLLGRLLQSPFAQFMGRLSYSFYLYHALCVILVCHYVLGQPSLGASTHPLEAALLASLLVVALTIPIAYVSKSLFEDPFIRLGKRPLFGTMSSIGPAVVKTGSKLPHSNAARASAELENSVVAAVRVFEPGQR